MGTRTKLGGRLLPDAFWFHYLHGDFPLKPLKNLLLVFLKTLSGSVDLFRLFLVTHVFVISIWREGIVSSGDKEHNVKYMFCCKINFSKNCEFRLLIIQRTYKFIC